MAQRKKALATRLKPEDRLAQASDLQDIRLVEVHCKQAIKEGPLPAITAVNAQVVTQIGKPDDVGAGSYRVIISLFLTAQYQADDAEPAIAIMAKYQLTFTTARLTLATKTSLGPFGERCGLLMTWPYWREYVNNVMGRMGLPAFVVPLLKANTFQRQDVPADKA